LATTLGGFSIEYFAAMIYHIVTATEWETASRKPLYSHAAFAADGYIHCCTALQLEYVGNRYFRGQRDLVILCIDAHKVTAPIKYEDLNAEGMLFPHVYGMLNTDAVKKVAAFPPSPDGTFRIPAEIDH
jgi:uncharacterized protein (DUF952 family)